MSEKTGRGRSGERGPRGVGWKDGSCLGAMFLLRERQPAFAARWNRGWLRGLAGVKESEEGQKAAGVVVVPVVLYLLATAMVVVGGGDAGSSSVVLYVGKDARDEGEKGVGILCCNSAGSTSSLGCFVARSFYFSPAPRSPSRSSASARAQ